MPMRPTRPGHRPYFIRSRDLGEIQRLLLRCCQPDTHGFVSIPMLAGQLGCERSTLYRWISRNRVPNRRVPELIALAEGRVPPEDFTPFIDI